ncbi:retrovirus-related pol polyprotein from transposon TNT 1-94 [Tanacetum coccineum]
MSNMYEDPIYDEVGTSYDSNIPSEVQDHDYYSDNVDEYHQVHEMQSNVQHNYVVNSYADYTSDSNIILYDQYMEDNEEHVVQSNVSSVRNDALMSIIDDMHEQGVQSMSANKQVKVVNDTLNSELARYKELVGEYEKRAKFELTEREQKIDEQMRIIISDRNRKETSLKSELHSVQMQLRSTVDHNKSMKEEVTTLKKDFKQKEDKYIEEFLDIKRLKEKVEDRLFKQDQSVQTSALYNGTEIVMTNHKPAVVHDSEETLKIAELTRKRMYEKMKIPLYLTPEQIFWAKDENDRKKVEASVLKPLSTPTVYPPNTPVKLVPRVLPTKSQVKINLYTLTQLFTEFDKTCKKRITPTGVTEGERDVSRGGLEYWSTSVVDKKCAEIERKNLLIAYKNLIANCLSNQLLFAIEQSRCLDLEAEKFLKNLQMRNKKDVNNEMIRGCSKHMTKNRSKLKNFVKKFIGTVRFGNDHFGAIMGYEDYVIGDSVISRKHFALFLYERRIDLLKGRTPQNNGVVEDKIDTKLFWEAARTMLIFSKALMFLWAEAVATACYTQRNLFGALCYPTNDSEDLGKLQAKADIGIFVGYAPNRKGFRIYNKRTRRIMETIHVTFDELHQTNGGGGILYTSFQDRAYVDNDGQFSSGLIPNQVHATNYVLPTDKDLELLFQPMFDEYFEVTRVDAPVPSATAVNAHAIPPVGSTIEDTPITQATLHPSNNPVTGEPGSAQSSSGDVSIAEPNQVNQPPAHLRKWSKDHPLDNIVGNPSRPVSTRKQLASDALWCCFHTELSKLEPKNFKMVVIEDCWFQAMQDEIHKLLSRLEVGK